MIRIGSTGLVVSLIAACAGGGTDDAKAYARKGKETEARLLLMQVTKSLRVRHAERGELPAGAVGPSPATPCCQGAGRRCPAVATDWTDPLWQQLDFAPEEALRFQYGYQSDGKTFALTAVGDLDCDGKPSSFKVTGKVEGGILTVDDHEIAARR